jgi:small conductance mechanosensitive channel
MYQIASLPLLLREFLISLCVILLTALSASSAISQEATQQELPVEILSPSIKSSELDLRLLPLTKSDLEKATGVWLQNAKQEATALVDVLVRLKMVKRKDGEGEATNKLRELAATITRRRNVVLGKLSLVAKAWEAKGGKPESIADIRAYRNSMLVKEVRQSDWQTLTKRAVEWAKAPNGGLQLLTDLAIFAGALLLVVVFARTARRLTRRTISRVPNLSQLLQSFIIGVVHWASIAIGLMILLTALDYDITPLFAVVGGAVFIVAFAFQEPLGNLAAGVMIMINQPFDEGDYVDIAGTAGTVKSVGFVATTVTTADNQIIVIPNSNVWGSVIRNVTTSPTRRVDMVFGIGYGDSISKAQAALTDVVTAHPLVLDEPAPVIRVHELADSSVNFVVRPWVKGGDYWNVYWDLMQQVKERFDADGISIPFPQRDVHLHGAVNSDNK